MPKCPFECKRTEYKTISFATMVFIMLKRILHRVDKLENIYPIRLTEAICDNNASNKNKEAESIIFN